MSEELKEKVTLPFGVIVDGKVHRDCVLRPRKVRDSVEVMRDPLAATEDSYRGVVLIGKQIESLGDLPREQITPELLLDLLDADMQELLEGNRRLEVRIRKFRKSPGSEGSKEAGSSDDCGGVSPGGGHEHDRSGSGGATGSLRRP